MPRNEYTSWAEWLKPVRLGAESKKKFYNLFTSTNIDKSLLHYVLAPWEREWGYMVQYTLP